MISTSLLKKCSQIKRVWGNPDSIEYLIFSTDSRKVQNENAFICLYGPNYDAYQLIEDLLKSSLRVIIFETNHSNENERDIEIGERYKRDSSKVFISVKNIFDFLTELSQIRMKDWKEKGGICIGLTGSNGKTTNKELVAYALNEIEPNKVHSTFGNLNNHIGVPLTLFQLKDNHKYAVIEMGSNNFGEIAHLANIASPDFGLITSIGEAHLEFFKDLTGVLKEKSALLDTVEMLSKKNPSFVINEDDKFLNKLLDRNRILSFGVNSSQVKVKYNDDEAQIVWGEKKYSILNNQLIGHHNLVNKVQSFLLCAIVMPDKKSELCQAINEYIPPENNRGNIKSWDGKKVFLDAYNANPASMRASLGGFINSHQNELNKILFILGDMNELGDNSEKYHYEIGAILKEYGIRNAIFVGRFSRAYAEGLGGGLAFNNLKELKPHIFEHTKTINWIFIKGSRSLQLESILDITNT
jgi:UDP-N-acetylmuramoyl-tripeptide--D-alanyl-D-alanine ligase